MVLGTSSASSERSTPFSGWGRKVVDARIAQSQATRWSGGGPSGGALEGPRALTEHTPIHDAEAWVTNHRVRFFETIMSSRAFAMLPHNWTNETLNDVLSALNETVGKQEAEPSQFFATVFTAVGRAFEAARASAEAVGRGANQLAKNTMFNNKGGPEAAYAAWKKKNDRTRRPQSWDDRIWALVCAAVEYIDELGASVYHNVGTPEYWHDLTAIRRKMPPCIDEEGAQTFNWEAEKGTQKKARRDSARNSRQELWITAHASEERDGPILFLLLHSVLRPQAGGDLRQLAETLARDMSNAEIAEQIPPTEWPEAREALMRAYQFSLGLGCPASVAEHKPEEFTRWVLQAPIEVPAFQQGSAPYETLKALVRAEQAKLSRDGADNDVALAARLALTLALCPRDSPAAMVAHVKRWMEGPATESALPMLAAALGLSGDPVHDAWAHRTLPTTPERLGLAWHDAAVARLPVENAYRVKCLLDVARDAVSGHEWAKTLYMNADTELARVAFGGEAAGTLQQRAQQPLAIIYELYRRLLSAAAVVERPPERVSPVPERERRERRGRRPEPEVPAPPTPPPEDRGRTRSPRRQPRVSGEPVLPVGPAPPTVINEQARILEKLQQIDADYDPTSALPETQGISSVFSDILAEAPQHALEHAAALAAPSYFGAIAYLVYWAATRLPKVLLKRSLRSPEYRLMFGRKIAQVLTLISGREGPFAGMDVDQAAKMAAALLARSREGQQEFLHCLERNHADLEESKACCDQVLDEGAEVRALCGSMVERRLRGMQHASLGELLSWFVYGVSMCESARTLYESFSHFRLGDFGIGRGYFSRDALSTRGAVGEAARTTALNETLFAGLGMWRGMRSGARVTSAPAQVLHDVTSRSESPTASSSFAQSMLQKATANTAAAALQVRPLFSPGSHNQASQTASALGNAVVARRDEELHSRGSVSEPGAHAHAVQLEARSPEIEPPQNRVWYQAEGGAPLVAAVPHPGGEQPSSARPPRAPSTRAERSAPYSSRGPSSQHAPLVAGAGLGLHNADEETGLPVGGSEPAQHSYGPARTTAPSRGWRSPWARLPGLRDAAVSAWQRGLGRWGSTAGAGAELLAAHQEPDQEQGAPQHVETAPLPAAHGGGSSSSLLAAHRGNPPLAGSRNKRPREGAGYEPEQASSRPRRYDPATVRAVEEGLAPASPSAPSSSWLRSVGNLSRMGGRAMNRSLWLLGDRGP